jgi:hypothetical protein
MIAASHRRLRKGQSTILTTVMKKVQTVLPIVRSHQIIAPVKRLRRQKGFLVAVPGTVTQEVIEMVEQYVISRLSPENSESLN